MRKENGETVLQDNELCAVPSNKRKNMFTIIAVLMCWIINPTPATTGGSIATGMTLPMALLAIFIGAIILGLYSMPISAVGAKEGLSTSMVAKIAFGEKGANIVAVAMAIANIVFYGVTVGFFLPSLEVLFNLPAGSSQIWGGIVFCLLMGTSAFLGFKGVARLSNIIVIPMCIVFVVAAIKGIVDGGGWSTICQIGPTSDPLDFGTAVTTAIGIFVAGATLASDVTRYSKNGKQASISSILSFGVCFFIFVSLGAIAVKGTGSSDLVSLICSMGGVVFSIIGFLLLLFSTWSSADNNVYSAGLAMSKLFNCPKWICTIVTVVIGAIVCVTGVYGHLSAYCGILGMLMPPIGIIIAIDYFLIKKNVSNKMASIKNYHSIAIISWVIAVVGDFFTGNPLGILPYHIGVSGINSLVLGAVVYFILAKCFVKTDSAANTAA